MKPLIFLFAMLFCHIVDDYYLQGWLSSAKQKEWWKKNAPDILYKNDYLMALYEHAFSWCFMVHLPLMVCNIVGAARSSAVLLAISFFTNSAIHAFADNLKANKKKINLIQDQLIHIVQVLAVWVLFFVF